MSSRTESEPAPPPFEVRREDGWLISDNPSRIDLEVVHGFLSRAYWCAGISRERVERALRHSLVFGLYTGDRQLGYARVVTDRATFAYLCDVFVLEEARGRGLGKWMMQVVGSHPDLQGLRRFVLATRDAHGLYEGFGFTPLKNPESFMERYDPEVYRRPVAREQEPG